jgi:uncharacterized protein with HEPN domain
MKDDEILSTLHAHVGRLSMSCGQGAAAAHIADLAAIADAATALSPEFRRRHPSIPWIVLVEMGPVIRRAGQDLDLHMLETTLQIDIPELDRRLKAL